MYRKFMVHALHHNWGFDFNLKPEIAFVEQLFQRLKSLIANHDLVFLTPYWKREIGVQNYQQWAQLSEMVYVEILVFRAHLKIANKSKILKMICW